MVTHSTSSPRGHPNKSPPDPDMRTHTPTHDPDSEPEEEARPSHTAEIGTLKKLSVPGGTAWLGSSSGVYFVNTVRRAFSAAFAANSNNLDGNSDPDTVPASEDIITGEDAAGRSFNGSTNTTTRNAWWLHDADFHRRIVAAVGRPPADQNVAMELVTHFFRTTHPLFPFLHGPKFLDDVNEIYTALSRQSPKQPQPSKPISAPQPKRTTSTSSITSTTSLGNIHSIDPLKLITFQIIINIASLSHNTTPTPVPSLPPTSTIPSAQSLLTLILPLSTTPLLPTIQLLLAAELYLLSTISLRHSSTLAGLVLRLIYHAGLHRCPLRYASLTPQDCEIRKRVFWSAYALDRHLSLALGDPNTFQDSDIDVCLSRDGDGEMHRAVARDLLTEEEREVEMKLHWPRDGTGRRVILVDEGTQKPAQRLGVSGNTNETTTNPNSVQSTHHLTDDTNTTSTPDSHPPPNANANANTNTNTNNPKPTPTTTNSTSSPRAKQLREAALTAYVHYGKLTGRIIEIFHKSINFRFPKEDAISFLSADIENWWNDLPSTLTGDSNPSTSSTPHTDSSNSNRDKTSEIPPALLEQHRALTPFFTLLYHQLLLLLNRPRLSLDQSTAPFHQGLQTCIRASRATISSLHAHRQNGQSMFLPGLLSATWMSGLIIAFACQLGKYPRGRAVEDITACLGLLGGMRGGGGGDGKAGGYTVRNCVRVLELLRGDISVRKRGVGTGGGGWGRGGSVDVGGSGGLGLGSGSGPYGSGMGMGATPKSQNSSTRKRTRDSILLDDNRTNSETESSPKRNSLAGVSPASSDFRSSQRVRSPPETRSGDNNQSQSQNHDLPTHGIKNTNASRNTHNNGSSTATNFLRNDSTMSNNDANTNFDFDFSGHNQNIHQIHHPNLRSHNHTHQNSHLHQHQHQPPAAAFQGVNLNTTNSNTDPNLDPPISTNTQNTATAKSAGAGAALYADPQDIAFAQSNHSMGLSLPDMPSLDDQMFWGNMDSNLFDVFGAVSWENMTGPVGPIAGNIGGSGNGNGGLGAWDMGMGGFGSGGDGNVPSGGGGGFM